MKLEKMLRDLSLRAVTFLIILIALWAVVLFVGVAFNWSFLTDKVSEAFYLGGFVIGLLVFSLAVMNVTASLSMIARAQTGEGAADSRVFRQFAVMVAVAVAVVAVIVGGLWYAEQRVYEHVKSDTEAAAQTLLSSEPFARLVAAVKDDLPIKTVQEICAGLGHGLDSSMEVFCIIPRERAGTTVYYEINRWSSGKDEDKPLSQVSLRRFTPSRREKADFDKLASGQIEAFVAPAGNSKLRCFAARTVDGQQVIVMIEASRQLGDYRSSFK